MIVGELHVTALVAATIGYAWSLSGTMTTDPFMQFEDEPLPSVVESGFLSTGDFASFNIITDLGTSVVEIYLAPSDAAATEYQRNENIIRAYSVPLIVSEAGQIGLFGDEGEGEFFKMPPGTYQVIAEARYLQKDEVPAYAEIFPKLNNFLAREWVSFIEDEAPELWRLTFIPTDEPTEAVELYRELSLRERRQRGLE